MKKILFLIAVFTTTILSAQTGGYWAMEFKAKTNMENNISEALFFNWISIPFNLK